MADCFARYVGAAIHHSKGEVYARAFYGRFDRDKSGNSLSATIHTDANRCFRSYAVVEIVMRRFIV